MLKLVQIASGIALSVKVLRRPRGGKQKQKILKTLATKA
jgi:hypothetical protein